MQWTKDQKRIIDIRNSNILVSAAAGSGKTAVLVERIIKLVKDENKDIDEFLVVTFTKAAARGMRRKIQKALVEASHTGENIRHIRRQLSLLNRAYITTIDSFCMDIVKNNFHIIGLDPGFRMGDNSELNILFHEAIDEVLEREYIERKEDFINLVESFSENRGDSGLTNLINNMYEFIKIFPKPLNWLNKNIEKIDMDLEDFKKSDWNRELLKYINMQLEGAKESLELGLKICDEQGDLGPYEESLKEDLITIEELLSSCEEDLESFLIKIQSFNPPQINSISKKDVSDLGKKDQVKDLRDSYKDIVNLLKPNFPYRDLDTYVSDLKHMYSPMKALGRVIIELDRVYMAKKLSKSLVDFNDLEHYALQILKSSEGDIPSYIGHSYRDKLKYIFIDEYQDSNGLQEAIMEQIKRRDNLFMVGDIKQSIYRFRLADPDIFNYKYKTFEKDNEDLKEDKIHRVIELNKNFRSRGEILEATNFIFSKIMTEEVGEIDYNENVILRQGNTEFKEEIPVELNIIDRDSEIDNDKKDDIGKEIENMKVTELEAVFTANKIRELLEENTFDSDCDGNLRKIEYKDIVILSRNLSKAPAIYEEVFRKEGIPFYFEGGNGYFDTIEIQVMINLLKLIDNTRQDIPLLSVMRSPIGNFTIEELTKIRAKYKKGSYMIACKKYMKKIEENPDEKSEEAFSEDLIFKLDNFFNKVYDWTNRSRYTQLDDLIWEILVETDYYSFVGGLTNGKVRQANLRLFADKAYEFENTSMRGLFKFLLYIEKVTSDESQKSSMAKTLGENDNVVRMMTIHKSKGLEFPVVILSKLSGEFIDKDTSGDLLTHKDLGIAPKYLDIENRIKKETITRQIIAHKIKLESLSEEMRLLYVGMTRAVDRLIMVGSIRNINSSFKKWGKGYSKHSVYKGKSYMDWIGASLFEGKDPEEIEDILEKGKCGKWNVNRISLEELSGYINTSRDIDIIEEMNKSIIDISDKDYSEIDRRLSFKYPYKNSVDVPSKMSVTAIKNLNSNQFKKIGYKRPEMCEILECDKIKRDKTSDKKEFKGSEIGTLIHLVMEHIDIEKPLDREGLILQLDDILSKGFISEDEKRFIKRNYLDKIQNFYNSHIGLRMIKSKKVKKEAPFIIKRSADKIIADLNKDDFVLVQGIIDCYFEEDGELVIIDYKTDSVKDNIEEIKEEYKEQISLYKEALEKLTKKKVKESYLYLLSSGDLVTM